MKKVSEFIKDNLGKTVRTVSKDSGTYIGLPNPFSVPSVNGCFQEMYYWDTYFINVGLIADGYTEQAKNNCDNLKFLVDRYGFIPNASRTYYLTRSQPPYFAFAVKDLEDFYAIEELKSVYKSIKREYLWWNANRTTAIGLNRYGDNGVSDELYAESSAYAKERIEVPDGTDEIELGKDHFAVCESGWDCSPRFGQVTGCKDSCPVDLNSNLFFYETYLGYLQKKLGIEDGENWTEKSENRKSLVNKYLWNEEKSVFFDYNFVTGKQSEVVSCAAFQPYFVKMVGSDKTGGLKNLYKRLMKKCGLAATDKDYGKYQWSYPNGWANLHYIAYVALKNYGLYKEARELASKYTALVEKNFERTGCLWEKYNVVSSGEEPLSEYKTPEMLGWTAGVYEYLKGELCVSE